MAAKPLAQGQANINVAAERNDKYVTVTVKYRTLAACKPGLTKVAGPIVNAMIEAAELADVQVLATQRAEDVRETDVLFRGRVVTKWLADKDGKPEFLVETREATDADADLPTVEDLMEEKATV